MRRPHRPNVLIITVDTLRADRVGAYGFSGARTPHMDALAREGVRCADAVAVAPITLPSHASLLTGLLPPAHGVRDNGEYALGAGARTLAERLKTEGYETHAVVSAVVLGRRYGLAQGFDAYDDDLWAEDAPRLFMIRDRPAHKTAARARTWLQDWRRRGSSAPFFLWVHFYDPHQPYEPPEDEARLGPTPYDAEIATADRGVGEVLSTLREQGVLDDTIVMLTADHGESLGEHQEKTHALFIYDATVRVPLIWRYPARLPAGAVYNGPVRHTDVLPTILSLIGLAAGDRVQGVDLGPPLRGAQPAPSLPQYSESLLAELGFGMAPLVGVRDGGFKWVRAPKPELYDLAADPGELTNLYEPGSERAARLDSLLQQLIDESARVAVPTEANPAPREMLETLQSLGYLAPHATRQSMGGMDPKDGIGIYNLLENARHHAQGRRWRDAEVLLRQIIDKVPRHVSARNVLGLALARQGRLAEAKDEYLQSLAVDTTQHRVVALLGSVAMLQGEMDEAKQRFEQALAMSPQFVEAMVNLGLIAAMRNDGHEAQRWYQAAIDVDAGFPTPYKRTGDLYFEQGDFARALEHYRKTLTIAPNHFQALIQAGNSARRLDDPAGAAAFFEKAAKLRPDSWIPSYNLACLRAVGGEPGPALDFLTQSLDRGLNDVRLLEADADLASLRALPTFSDLVVRARQNARRRGGTEG